MMTVTMYVKAGVAKKNLALGSMIRLATVKSSKTREKVDIWCESTAPDGEFKFPIVNIFPNGDTSFEESGTTYAEAVKRGKQILKK